MSNRLNTLMLTFKKFLYEDHRTRKEIEDDMEYHLERRGGIPKHLHKEMAALVRTEKKAQRQRPRKETQSPRGEN